MLNSDHKPIAREATFAADQDKSAEETSKLFQQSQQNSVLKPDFLEKQKRVKMSSATTVSTIAQSQLTTDTNFTGRASQATRTSRKRSGPNCNSGVNIGVRRKSDLKIDALELGCQMTEHELQDF